MQTGGNPPAGGGGNGPIGGGGPDGGGPVGGAPPEEHCCGTGDFFACANGHGWTPFALGDATMNPFTLNPDLCTGWYAPFTGNDLPPRVAVPNLTQDFVAVTKMTVTVDLGAVPEGRYRVGGLLVAPTTAFEPDVASPWAKWELGFTNPDEDLLFAYRPLNQPGEHLNRSCSTGSCDEPTGEREGALGVCWEDGVVHAFFAPLAEGSFMEYSPVEGTGTEDDIPTVMGPVAVSFLAGSDYYLGSGGEGGAGGTDGGTCGDASDTHVITHYFGVRPLGDDSCVAALNSLKGVLDDACR